jgi:hypothetical protein
MPMGTLGRTKNRQCSRWWTFFSSGLVFLIIDDVGWLSPSLSVCLWAVGIGCDVKRLKW